MNYLELKFVVDPSQPGSEILIAELDLLGFESFVELEDGVMAYIPVEEYEPELLTRILILQSDEFDISFTTKEIKQVNWNSEWEKNFQPIMVGNSCCVRAPFHPKSDLKYDIVIEPKMSFGTGHHVTTHMMIQFLLRQDLKGKRVLDMGCGTGVLAILAEKKGAKAVVAIDIDNWCYLNSLENVERNECELVSVFEGDSGLLESRKYDVIVANINRNILLKDIEIYSRGLESGGELFLSGFYAKDIPTIRQACEAQDLSYKDYLERDDWVALQFKKP